VVFADARHQPRASHPVADRSADLAESELDAQDAQLDEQCRDHVHRRHIEIRRRADVDDDRVGRLGSGRDEAHDLFLQHLAVTGAIFIPDHEIDRKSLQPPIGVRLHELAHEIDIFEIADLQQHDGQIARDCVTPQA